VRAEAVWEGPLGQDLFTYDPDSTFPVNFVYDDRQAQTEAEYGFRERLDAAEEVNETIRAQYEAMQAQYEALARAYEERVVAYEARLAAYNETVRAYNQDGGAPPEVFATLDAERQALDREQRDLTTEADELNAFVDDLNRVGEQGNLLVEKYNRGVGEYNETFGVSRAFTQGDYRGTEINIYSFTSIDELVLVLAHELGHALGIDHVDGRASIMYSMIGEQPANLALSESDIKAALAVCTGRW
jgi:hypothetical protein